MATVNINSDVGVSAIEVGQHRQGQRDHHRVRLQEYQ